MSGPLNKGAGNADVLSGRGISKIVVSQTDPNVIFVASRRARPGSADRPPAWCRRVPEFIGRRPRCRRLRSLKNLRSRERPSVSRNVSDLVIDPANANRLIAAVVGGSNDGGVYLSTDALGAVPTFARTLTTTDGNTSGRAELAVNNVGGTVTIYAATGTNNGTVYKSTDGGATFPQLSGGASFCNGQCFYDIAVAVDPGDANKVYLGGSPALPFGKSVNGGTSFINSSQNLHVDTQVIAVAPSNPSRVYFGSDGGIWRRTMSTRRRSSWQSLNNSSISATQFQGIALHPVDRNYTIGGTQDNGTQYLGSNGTSWIRSDGGDGGFAVIDRNATTAANVISYHTYYNQTSSQIGFVRALATETGSGDPIWQEFFGCGGTTSNNGILCADPVLFYAADGRRPGQSVDALFRHDAAIPLAGHGHDDDRCQRLAAGQDQCHRHIAAGR